MPRTARAAILAGFDLLVSDLGGNPADICNQTGLELSQLEDPDSTIPVTLLLRVMSLSAQTTKCDHFGLELAKQRELDRYLGLLGDIATSAVNLGDALRKVFNLMHLHSESSLWHIQTNGEVSHITFAQIEGSADSYKQVEQLALTLLWRFINVIARHHWHPSMVSFTYSKPTNLIPYRKIYNVPIIFDADFCGIVFHTSDLKISLPEYNKSQHEALYSLGQSIKDHKEENFKESVRTLIRKNLELKLVGEEYITRFFPFQKRTMQRRLKAQNTSYRELLNEVRLTMAIDLLTNSNISITRLADRLCYTDLANFSKAFTQYTGLSPRVWVKKIKSSSSKNTF